MTTPRRQRKWFNEKNTLTPASATQDSFTLSTTGFDKGETAVREILTVTIRLVSINTPVEVAVAIWVGQFGGIPSNIFADSSESYMLWDGFVWEDRGGGSDAQLIRSYDLRGQRSSRSDSEDLHFIVRNGGGAGTLTCDVFSRILMLLP